MKISQNFMEGSGCINLILGPMFSSKSTTLDARVERYVLGNRKCIGIKYKNDTRYDNDKIVTHRGNKIDIFTVVCLNLYEADELVQDYDIIAIDEVQFYKDAVIFCDKWANQGKIVEACGLNGTYERKPFKIITELVPLAQDIIFKTAVCKETGFDAIYSKRTSNENTEVVIGGADKYSAVDRITYFNDNYLPTFINNMKDFAIIYAELTNNKDEKYVENCIGKFMEKHKNNFRRVDIKRITFVEFV